MKGCIKTYKSENSTIHKIGWWDIQFLTYAYSIAINYPPLPPIPLPFGPYFWLLLCLEGLFSYWPKGRAMDKFYCFQANGENFRHLKSWRINFKIKFFIFSKQQLDFFFFLVLISLCHF